MQKQSDGQRDRQTDRMGTTIASSSRARDDIKLTSIFLFASFLQLLLSICHLMERENVDSS